MNENEFLDLETPLGRTIPDWALKPDGELKTFWFFCTNDTEAEIVKGDYHHWPKMRSDGGRWYTSSGRYDSEQELREKTGLQEKCRECGLSFTTQYIPEVEKKLIERQLCHTCNHWTELMKCKAPIRVNGGHYQDAGATNGNKTDWNGFGGRKFVVKMHDGRVIETNNMWFQGDIPAHFRDRLPDNAEFITGSGPVKMF